MAKDCRIGHHCRNRVQLPVHERHITGMDSCCHCLFQGLLQVHLQDSLFSACGSDNLLYPQQSGLLTILGYETDIPKQISVKLYKTELSCRAALFVCLVETGELGTMVTDKRIGNKKYRLDSPVNYRAKLANASFRTARPGPEGFGKNHPHCVPVFFPKALPFRKHSP